jgi:hypothetical protein
LIQKRTLAEAQRANAERALDREIRKDLMREMIGGGELRGVKCGALVSIVPQQGSRESFPPSLQSDQKNYRQRVESPTAAGAAQGRMPRGVRVRVIELFRIFQRPDH